MIPFTKAHACGNDFLIVEEDAAKNLDGAELTRRLCQRNTGIGADGVEFFQWTGDTSGRIRLHNADGSIAEISGNGTRCVAAWMAEERGAQPGDEFAIETDAGPRLCTIQEFRDSDIDGPTTLITADMDVPEFEERTIELADGASIDGVHVSMGNPNFVILVDSKDFSVAKRVWTSIGEEICSHRDFPQQTNVEFVRIVSDREIEIRIFERGVGPTTSSGTGSSASATAVLALRRCVSPLNVVAPGGSQSVTWSGPGTELQLTGSAALIARGEAW